MLSYAVLMCTMCTCTYKKAHTEDVVRKRLYSTMNETEDENMRNCIYSMHLKRFIQKKVQQINSNIERPSILR